MKQKISLVLSFFCLSFCMTGCGMSEEAKSAQAAIDALPASYSVSENDRLNKTENQYNRLSAEDQAKVKAEKLLDLKQAKEDYIKNEVEKINTAIDELDLTPEDEDDPDKIAELITADDLEKGTEDIDAIVSLIENLPAEEQYDINYRELQKKALACHELAEKKYIRIYSEKINAIMAYDSFNEWAYANINFADPAAYEKMLHFAGFLDSKSQVDTQKGVDAARAIADVHKQMNEIQKQISDETVTEDAIAVIDTLQSTVETNRKELKTTLEELLDQAYKNAAFEKALTQWCGSYQKVICYLEDEHYSEQLDERVKSLLSMISQFAEDNFEEEQDDLQDLLSKYDKEFDQYEKGLQKKKDLISDMIKE